MVASVLDGTQGLPGQEPEEVHLSDRLLRSADALGGRLAELLHLKPVLDEDVLDEVEALLLGADVGLPATQSVTEALRVKLRRRELLDQRSFVRALRAELLAILQPVEQVIDWDSAPKPFLLLVVGVNGAGKTTTIAKIAARAKAAGKSVMLAAGDTFRAAAVEQLKTWGERNEVPVISQGPGADPAAVIFDAYQSARAKGVELVIADTAGRLHTQSNLMDELKKIVRVIKKVDPSAPHETLLVLDGTFGQNAISQARNFHAAVPLTGLVITKLDGTAKGGVIFGLARELGIPVRFVGVGEKLGDLRDFNAREYVNALIPESIGQRT